MSELSANSNSLNESQSQTTPDPKPRCAHITSKGRRCRLPVLDTRSSLCFRHFQLSQAALAGPAPAADSAVVASELLAGIEDFSRAESINLFLGNLVKQLAYKRIARPDAIALAYIGQLLLNSLPAMQRESEAERDASAGRGLLEAVGLARAARAKENQPAGETTVPGSDRVQVIWR